MKLSLIVMTKNGSWRLERLLRNIANKVSEIVIGIDAATTDDTEEIARRYTSHVFRIHNPHGYIEPYIKTLFERCTGNWVLRLDDDELISMSFSLESFPPEVLDKFELVGFPRVWVVNTNPLSYIGTGCKRWEIVPQYRLMKRTAQWSFISKIHTPGFEMKPAYIDLNTFIYHLNLLDQSPEERHRKYDFYQSHGDASWNRNYLHDPAYLYQTKQSLLWPPDRSSPPIYCYDLTAQKPLLCSYDMFPPLKLMQSNKADFLEAS